MLYLDLNGRDKAFFYWISDMFVRKISTEKKEIAIENIVQL